MGASVQPEGLRDSCLTPYRGTSVGSLTHSDIPCLEQGKIPWASADLRDGSAGPCKVRGAVFLINIIISGSGIKHGGRCGLALPTACGKNARPAHRARLDYSPKGVRCAIVSSLLDRARKNRAARPAFVLPTYRRFSPLTARPDVPGHTKYRFLGMVITCLHLRSPNRTPRAARA